jgi:hypothetical protein
MPWNPAQHRLFEWAAHNPGAAQSAGYHIPQAKAATMASEGIRQPGAAPNPMQGIQQNAMQNATKTHLVNLLRGGYGSGGGYGR